MDAHPRPQGCGRPPAEEPEEAWPAAGARQAGAAGAAGPVGGLEGPLGKGLTGRQLC